MLTSTIYLSICCLYIFLLVKLKFQDSSIVKESYLNPIKNFIDRYGKLAILILLLISLYRMADVVMGVMANIFYLEKGYSIGEIATYSKFFGVFATIAAWIILNQILNIDNILGCLFILAGVLLSQLMPEFKKLSIDKPK